MSRKSVPFSVPEGASRPSGDRRRPGVINAHSDEWVSDRNNGGRDAAPDPSESLVLDLAAERSFTEVVALSALTPFTLGWFWLIHAMNGKARF